MSSIEQPVLPAETPFGDLEQYFISLQPKNLWPENQDSNLGLLRFLICNSLEQANQLLAELANETFIVTSTGYLGLWEDELGLPKYQGGRTDDQRRAALLARREIGPFTRTRRARLIERFITETFGTALSFGADGITIGAGVPLYADSGDVTDLYEVVEDISDFSYTVYILNTVTPDIDSLTRELTHITPAHISFTIDNSVSVLP